MKTYLHSIRWFWSCVIFVGLSSGGFANNTQHTMARIGKKEFHEKDLSIPIADFRKAFKLKSGNSASAQEIDAATVEMKFVEIKAWAYQELISLAAGRLDIQVTLEEENEYVTKAVGDGKELSKKIEAVIEKLPIALREARSNLSKEREVYQRYFGNGESISYALWQKHLEHAGSEGLDTFIEKIKSKSPPSEQDIVKQVRSSSIPVLLENKLRDSVLEKVKANKDEIDQYFYEKYKLTPKDKMYGDLYEHIASTVQDQKEKSTWEKWLQEEWRKLPIKIFSDALAKRYAQFLENL